MSNSYHAIIVGAGPAGSGCAAHLARAGRRVLLLDKDRFPRDKVCGDCLNPSVWPVLDRLDLRARVLALPHTVARAVTYHGIDGPPLHFPLPDAREIVVKRRDLDQLLVTRAIEAGAEFRDGAPVAQIAQIAPGWRVDTATAPLLLAADGRNSTVARLAGRLPASTRERAALQCHAPLPADHGDHVRMRFHPGGYGGTARVSATEMNLCLVAHPRTLAAVRAAAEREFGLPADTVWRTIAPISRRDARDVARDGLFLLGDAARVVEPFTGEGIYYALRSGELAAEAILAGGDATAAEAAYRRAHRAMYRGRLWLNQLARFAGTHPRLTSAALRAFLHWPAPLGMLTAKVVVR